MDVYPYYGGIVPSEKDRMRTDIAGIGDVEMCDVSIEHGGSHEQARLGETLFSSVDTAPFSLDKYIFAPRLESLDEGEYDVLSCSRNFAFVGDRAALVLRGAGETIIKADFLTANAVVSGIPTSLDPSRVVMAVTTQPLEVMVDAGEIRIKGRGVLQTAMEQQQVSEEGTTIRWEDRVMINERRYQELPGQMASGIVVLIVGSVGGAVVGLFLGRKL